MEIKTILAMTDLETDSLTGLRGAFHLAKSHNAKVVVGHVLVPRTLDNSDVKEFLEEHGFDPKSVSIEIEVDADVHSGIDLIVGESHPDLIVISSHRKRGLKRLMWASVPVGLVGETTAPVLALHSDKDHFEFRRAIVCCDGTDQSQELIDAAAKLVGRDGEIVSLMVIEDSPIVIGGFSIGNYSDETLNKARAAATKFLNKLRINRSDVSMRTDVRVGNVVEQIKEAGEQHDADLVVVGTGGVGGKAKFFIDSVSEEVTRQVDVATLVVPTNKPTS